MLTHSEQQQTANVHHHAFLVNMIINFEAQAGTWAWTQMKTWIAQMAQILIHLQVVHQTLIASQPLLSHLAVMINLHLLSAMLMQWQSFIHSGTFMTEERSTS